MVDDIKKNPRFKPVPKNVNFIEIEHQILDWWSKDKTFEKLVDKNKGNKHWSFLDGPITANNPMGVHHAWGRTLKDIFQRFYALNGYDLRILSPVESFFSNNVKVRKIWSPLWSFIRVRNDNTMSETSILFNFISYKNN